MNEEEFLDAFAKAFFDMPVREPRFPEISPDVDGTRNVRFIGEE